jgi:hypothetical protein
VDGPTISARGQEHASRPWRRAQSAIGKLPEMLKRLSEEAVDTTNKIKASWRKHRKSRRRLRPRRRGRNRLGALSALDQLSRQSRSRKNERYFCSYDVANKFCRLFLSGGLGGGALTFYALWSKGDVRALFSHGRTVFKLEKERNSAGKMTRLKKLLRLEGGGTKLEKENSIQNCSAPEGQCVWASHKNDGALTRHPAEQISVDPESPRC